MFGIVYGECPHLFATEPFFIVKPFYCVKYLELQKKFFKFATDNVLT